MAGLPIHSLSIDEGQQLAASAEIDSSTATAALIASKAPSSAGSSAMAESVSKGPQARTTAVLSITFILERLDEQILTAVYTPIGKSLHATPSQLGALTLCRALVQALISPLSGLLGDNFNRIHIVAAGTFLWGAMTAAIGLSTTLQQAMAWSAFNGVGLAFVLPCAQSLVADYYAPAVRGRAFGFVFTMAALGGMAGGFFATSVSGKQPGGIEGWRFAFYVVAVLAAAAAVTNLLLGRDPRPRPAREGRPRPGGRLSTLGATVTNACRDLGRSLRAVLQIRTFQVLVLQGVVGGMPWTAMGYFTMWLQLLGFSNVPAAALTALFWGGTALGNFVGGAVGDALVRPLPDSGRQLTCQVSIATGLPLAAVLIKVLPSRDGSAGSMDGLAPAYAALMFIMGTLVSWPQTHNSAMFSEVVPDSLRSSVYAFDRCFEGAISALSAPLVGLIAERWFGYVADWHDPTPARQLSNARALGNGLLVCLVVPWGLQFLFYTLLYRTFPRDRDASKELECSARQRSSSQNDMLDLSAASEEHYSPPDQDAVQPRVGGDINKQGSEGGPANVENSPRTHV